MSVLVPRRMGGGECGCASLLLYAHALPLAFRCSLTAADDWFEHFTASRHFLYVDGCASPALLADDGNIQISDASSPPGAPYFFAEWGFLGTRYRA